MRFKSALIVACFLFAAGLAIGKAMSGTKGTIGIVCLDEEGNDIQWNYSEVMPLGFEECVFNVYEQLDQDEAVRKAVNQNSSEIGPSSDDLNNRWLGDVFQEITRAYKKARAQR